MFITILITTFLTTLAVMIHYEALHLLSRQIKRLSIRPRYRIVVVLLGALVAHIVEVYLFGAGYYLSVMQWGFGSFTGTAVSGFDDAVYFSFITYTSLGFGDVVPAGPARFLVGVESLLGLVLIAWTASYLYVQMQKFWDGD